MGPPFVVPNRRMRRPKVSIWNDAYRHEPTAGTPPVVVPNWRRNYRTSSLGSSVGFHGRTVGKCLHQKWPQLGGGGTLPPVYGILRISTHKRKENSSASSRPGRCRGYPTANLSGTLDPRRLTVGRRLDHLSPQMGACVTQSSV